MPELFQRAWLRIKQHIRSLNRQRLRRRRAARRASYAEWIARHDTVDEPLRARLRERLAAMPDPPLISVLLPTYNPNAEWLTEAVDSVQRQLYPHWQLCIADDASSAAGTAELLATFAAADARIRVTRRERNGHICHATNSALELATGSWVVLLDHDDVLAEHALLMVAEAARRFPAARLIYSDEDQLGPDGERESPYFKPDWNHDLCLSQNLVCHLAAFEHALLREVGGLRPGLEGAQDHDLVLRCVERLAPQQIRHIPHVLYHWRIHPDSTAGDASSKPYAVEAGRRAIQDHLDRRGVPARAEATGPGRYRVVYALPDPPPRVSIVIPTRNQVHLLRTCIESLTNLTDYPAYEVVLVDNGSDDAAAIAFIEGLRGRENFRVLHDPLQPFNYSVLNNRAVEQASGDVLVLMNNDIEIVEPGWLREMVSHAVRPEVGAVGARLLYPDRTVQHAGVVLGIGEIAGGVASPAFKGLPGRAAGPGGRAKLIQSYSAVTAACLAVRKSLYTQVQGLEEQHLAVAYNDVDFCLKLREAGLRNVWTPHATLIHHESVSRGRDLQPGKLERLLGEAAHMRARWGAGLDDDPAYNPNMNRRTADFSLSDSPRVSLATPWFLPRGEVSN